MTSRLHRAIGLTPGDVRFVTDGIESCAGQAKTAARALESLSTLHLRYEVQYA
jgi:hypothetical protein